MTSVISNHGALLKPRIALLPRILGALEVGLGIGLTGWGVLYLRFSYQYPTLDWEGWTALGGALLMWTGLAILLGGIGLLFLKKRRYLLHIPLLLWVLFFAIELY